MFSLRGYEIKMFIKLLDIKCLVSKIYINLTEFVS